MNNVVVVVFQASGTCGELLVSLSYLPTAERLTVVIMKAKELRVPNMTTPSGKLSTVLSGKMNLRLIQSSVFMIKGGEYVLIIIQKIGTA